MIKDDLGFPNKLTDGPLLNLVLTTPDGFPYSEERRCPKCARKRINKSRIRAVQMIDPESGVVLREFESISDAARTLKLNGANIGTVCRGGRPLAGGYSWKYKG